MRFSKLLAAFALSATLTAVMPTARAGHPHFANPGPMMNHINRCLGIGWSDGYHAPGSRNGWTAGAQKRFHHRSGWTTYGPTAITPAMSYEQPRGVEPIPTPARHWPH